MDATPVIIRAQQDPVWWVKTILGNDLWEKQREIIEAVRTKREVAVKSCHAAGKSYAAAQVALWFGACHCPSIVVTTAPTARQVRRILWKEIGAAYTNAKLPLGGKRLTQEINFGPEWFILGFTAADYDPDRFQGFHSAHILVIIDEASGVSPAINEAVDGILASGHSRKLEIGNPTDPLSSFCASFKTPPVGKITISAFDTPNFTTFGITLDDIRNNTWEQKINDEIPYPELISPQWVYNKYLRWGENSPMFKARVLAQFPDSSKDSLLKLSWVEQATTRELAAEGRVELGVDVARGGTNETVIVRRQGPVARVYDSFQDPSLMVTVGRVMQAIRDTRATLVKIDDTGLGGGVTDRLVELKDEAIEEGENWLETVRIVPIIAGTRCSGSEYFFNHRILFYWGLRERFEEGEIDIDSEDHELFAQLVSLEYTTKSSGHIIMTNKKLKVGDRSADSLGSDSPDRADALMLAYAVEEIGKWTEDDFILIKGSVASNLDAYL